MRNIRHLLLATVLIITTGCSAIFTEDSRHITEVLNEGFTPDSTGGKVALAPVAIPVGLTAVLVDSALITPVVKADDAFDNACEPFEVSSTGPFEIIVFPMRIVTSVAVFIGSEIFYMCIGDL